MRPLEYWVLYVRMRTRRNMGNGAPARWDTLTWRGRGAHRAQIKSLTVIGAGEAAYSASFRSILLLSSLLLCFFVWLFPYKVNPWTASGPWHSSILRSPLRQNLKLGPSKSIPVNANWGAEVRYTLFLLWFQIEKTCYCFNSYKIIFFFSNGNNDQIQLFHLRSVQIIINQDVIVPLLIVSSRQAFLGYEKHTFKLAQLSCSF